MNKTSKAKAKGAASKTAAAKPGAARKSESKTGKSAAAAKTVRKTIAAKAATASKRAGPVKAAPLVKSKTAASAAKPAPVKASAPLKVVKPMAQPAHAPAKSAVAPAPQAAAEPKKPVSQRHGFKTNEFIVYPAHGVGRIVSIEEQEVAGLKLELFVIAFDKDKMTLRVPTTKIQSGGMRKLAESNIVERAMETLKGRARIKRTMWSRRAQEYEAKINSGDLIAIAEVVRDLYRAENQPEQSYSERQLYEAALDRMAREIAAVEKLDDRGAVQKITEVLARSARGMRLERVDTSEGPDNHQAA